MLHNNNMEDKLISTSFTLSSDVKRDLVALFGPGDPDRDWRGLCKKLGFERFLQVSQFRHTAFIYNLIIF